MPGSTFSEMLANSSKGIDLMFALAGMAFLSGVLGSIFAFINRKR